MPFFPSYAAFTFPFVISAIGMKMFQAYLVASGNPLQGLSVLELAETVIAAVLVIYTLVRYLMFWFGAAAKKNEK